MLTVSDVPTPDEPRYPHFYGSASFDDDIIQAARTQPPASRPPSGAAIRRYSAPQRQRMIFTALAVALVIAAFIGGLLYFKTISSQNSIRDTASNALDKWHVNDTGFLLESCPSVTGGFKNPQWTALVQSSAQVTIQKEDFVSNTDASNSVWAPYHPVSVGTIYYSIGPDPEAPPSLKMMVATLPASEAADGRVTLVCPGAP